MSKTTFTLKRKLFTTFNGVSAANRVANPLPTAATSAFNQLPENFNKMGNQAQINTSMKAAQETIKNNSVATLNSTKPNFSTRFKQAGGWGKVGKVGLGVGAGAVALGALGVFGAKKAISKAGEQSDGSKLFSQINNDNMATTYTLKRKIYSLGLNGEVLTPQQKLAEMKAVTGKNTVAEMSKKAGGATTFNSGAQNAINLKRAEVAKTNRAYAEFRGNTAGIKGIPRAQGGSSQKVYEAGRAAGANSVGLKTAAMNTWNKMGTMGKVGVVGAGVVGTGLMAKGLFGGKKKDQ